MDNWDEARRVVVRYEVGTNGDLTNPTTLVELTAEKGEICFDGLKVDARGDIYVSAPGGVRVFSSQGRPLGIIATPELPAKFTFGDADRRTLYMTARSSLYRVRVGIPDLTGRRSAMMFPRMEPGGIEPPSRDSQQDASTRVSDDLILTSRPPSTASASVQPAALSRQRCRRQPTLTSPMSCGTRGIRRPANASNLNLRLRERNCC